MIENVFVRRIREKVKLKTCSLDLDQGKEVLMQADEGEMCKESCILLL